MTLSDSVNVSGSSRRVLGCLSCFERLANGAITSRVEYIHHSSVNVQSQGNTYSDYYYLAIDPK